MRVVLDTNVLIASLFSGSARELYERWLSGDFEVVYSKAVFHEYEGRMNIPFFARRPGGKRVLDDICRYGILVYPTVYLDVVEDPEDNKLIECALAGQAEALVTSDRLVLKLDGYEGIRIMKSGAFLAHRRAKK